MASLLDEAFLPPCQCEEEEMKHIMEKIQHGFFTGIGFSIAVYFCIAFYSWLLS